MVFFEKYFLYSLDAYVTLLEMYIGIIFSFIIIVSYFSLKNSKIVPLAFQSFFEVLYEFLAVTVNQQAGKSSQKIFPLLFILFLFILFSNLFGLIPFSFTITAYVYQTFSMSCSIIVALTIIGFLKHKLKFLKLFIPSGVPLFPIPLLAIIEVILYVSRAFSLAIRLSANMLAGHTLLNIISGFSILMSQGVKLNSYNLSSFYKNIFLFVKIFFATIPIIMVGIIFLLEMGIAFLQAYVFVVLTAIYLNDSFKGGH